MRRPRLFHRLLVAYRTVYDQCDAIYWQFCRCARAAPVPSHLARRRWRLEQLVSRLRKRNREHQA